MRLLASAMTDPESWIASQALQALTGTSRFLLEVAAALTKEREIWKPECNWAGVWVHLQS